MELSVISQNMRQQTEKLTGLSEQMRLKLILD